MKRFSVPVTFTVIGEMEVEAESAEQAIEIAKSRYHGVRDLQEREEDTDFALGEDPNSVTEVDSYVPTACKTCDKDLAIPGLEICGGCRAKGVR